MLNWKRAIYSLLLVTICSCTANLQTPSITKELVGIELSDSLSMMSAASVSALVFAHPKSQYFAVGQVGKDQVTDYAARKKYDIEKTERWLSPILNYERD